jgi:hypothetical protein
MEAPQPPDIAQPFAIVDLLRNYLAFEVLQSDPCDDRAERGTEENYL